MKLLTHGISAGRGCHPRGRMAFTLVEVMVASAAGLLVMASAMAFMNFAGFSMSGITGQTILNQRAGNTVEFIQSRIELATSVSNNVSGNTLTLSFDDNVLVDSDGDGKPYNDKDHFEQFKFIGVNGSTNTAANNILVYIPDIRQTNQQVLIPAGVHNLPGYNIFTVTNGATAVIRFSIVDGYAGDRYQSVDIQATGLPLNRAFSKNVISILP